MTLFFYWATEVQTSVSAHSAHTKLTALLLHCIWHGAVVKLFL